MDSGWIKALELPAKITGGLFVACTVIWILDGSATLNLKDVGIWLRPVILIIWVVSGCLFVASIISQTWTTGTAYWKRRTDTKEAETKEKSIVAQLDHLSEKETYEAAKALKGGSPSFESWAHSTGAGQLMAKGLIYSPLGTYHQDHFPYTFHDFAWEALQEKRETILEKEAAYERERKKIR
ncbi:MAG: hypothetical protein AAF202_10845 [Pseudomonadota bacterium]